MTPLRLGQADKALSLIVINFTVSQYKFTKVVDLVALAVWPGAGWLDAGGSDTMKPGVAQITFLAYSG